MNTSHSAAVATIIGITIFLLSAEQTDVHAQQSYSRYYLDQAALAVEEAYQPPRKKRQSVAAAGMPSATKMAAQATAKPAKTKKRKPLDIFELLGDLTTAKAKPNPVQQGANDTEVYNQQSLRKKIGIRGIQLRQFNTIKRRQILSRSLRSSRLRKPQPNQSKM